MQQEPSARPSGASGIATSTQEVLSQLRSLAESHIDLPSAPSPACLEAALVYTALGWPVIPLHHFTGNGCSCSKGANCKSIGKHPRVQRGLHDATTDLAQIRKWWRQWPHANVGIVTGYAVGLGALDIDPRHGGAESLRDLEAEYGALPETLCVETGGGGEHRYFAPPDASVTSKSNLRAGIDRKSEGGYIVAPPSLHASGGRYRWATLPDAGLAPMPHWFATLGGHRETCAAATCANATVLDMSGPIPQGQRNTALTSLAGRLRTQGREVGELEVVLSHHNRHRCTPPLAEDEVRAIAASVVKYPSGSASGTEDGEPTAHHASIATRLVAELSDLVLFRSPADDAYAAIVARGHVEIWPLRSKHMRRFVAGRCYGAFRRAASEQAVDEVLAVLEAQARFGGQERDVLLRVGPTTGGIAIDLVNDAWEAVVVTPAGWSVVPQSPVHFTRRPGMLALPRPTSGGSLSDLRRFLNTPDDDMFRLTVAWLTAGMRPTGPYPVMVLTGEQGSAKSTTARVLRALLDPNKAPSRSVPPDTRTLMIGMRNAWLAVYGNISRLPANVSDDLCRLATGGGFSTRALYTDDDEIVFEAQRPIVLDGIADFVDRSDLVDRSIFVTLPRILDTARRPEKEFWADFEANHPAILGALLDAVAGGLRELEAVTLARLPRMADFARWGCAVERALKWPEGAFMKAYTANRGDAHASALEASLIWQPLNALLTHGEWQGSATELRRELTALRKEDGSPRDDWPKNAQSLSRQLTRLAPNLRAAGIGVELGRAGDKSRSRSIVLTPPNDAASRVVAEREICDATLPDATDASDAITAGDGGTPPHYLSAVLDAFDGELLDEREVN